MQNLGQVVDTILSYLTLRVGGISFGCYRENRFLLVCSDGGVSLTPLETCILVVAVATALLSAFNLWRIAREEDRLVRLEALRGTTAGEVQRARVRRRPRGFERLGSIVAASRLVGKAEQQRLLSILNAVGIREHGDLARFVASKVYSAIAASGFAWLFLESGGWLAGSTTIRIALLLFALMVGWRVPDFVLSRFAAQRRLKIEHGLPDALDLLVICAEAGLSLDQSVDQVSQDLRASNAAVAEEFATTAAEMRVMSNRAEALENLVARTGVPGLRSITTTLNQAIRFGTPLAESLRVLAAEMRTVRLARIEERAARLPVLLAIPLALFILPSLMMVIGSPVALRLSDALKNSLGGI
jgi:tight adherence protein C